jgi:hypothetical protein
MTREQPGLGLGRQRGQAQQVTPFDTGKRPGRSLGPVSDLTPRQ